MDASFSRDTTRYDNVSGSLPVKPPSHGHNRARHGSTSRRASASVDEGPMFMVGTQFHNQTAESFQNTGERPLVSKRHHSKHLSVNSRHSSTSSLTPPPSESSKHQSLNSDVHTSPPGSVAKKRKRGSDDGRRTSVSRLSQSRRSRGDSIRPDDGTSHKLYAHFDPKEAKESALYTYSVSEPLESRHKRQRTQSPQSSSHIMPEQGEEEVPSVTFEFPRHQSQPSMPMSSGREPIIGSQNHLGMIVEEGHRETDGEEEKEEAERYNTKDPNITDPYEAVDENRVPAEDRSEPPNTSVPDQALGQEQALEHELQQGQGQELDLEPIVDPEVPQAPTKKRSHNTKKPRKRKSSTVNPIQTATTMIPANATAPTTTHKRRKQDLDIFLKDDETREKEREERAREREEKESFPTTPNFFQIFFGKWKIKPWYFSPIPAIRTEDLSSASAADYPSFLIPPSNHINNNNILNAQQLPPPSLPPLLSDIQNNPSNSTDDFLEPNVGQNHEHSIGTPPIDPTVMNQDQIPHISNDKSAIARVIAESDVKRTPSTSAGGARLFTHTPKDALVHAVGHTLWVCDRCFKYSDLPIDGHDNPYPGGYLNNGNICRVTHPPGHKLYDNTPGSTVDSEGRIRIYEVNPSEEKLYCQNLTLFGKFFIDWKSIFFECDGFLFYVTTSVINGVETAVGFFSKEKESPEDCNLACIITFPPYQSKGFGSLMIQFSYELSKYDNKIGSPERPLSDLGLRSYYTIWANILVDFLLEMINVQLNVENRPKRPTSEIPSLATNPHFDQSSGYSKPFGSARTYTSVENFTDGSARVHLSFDCTLQQIADGAFLTVADTSFALTELGLLRFSERHEHGDGGGGAGEPCQVYGINGDQKIIFTRELIFKVAQNLRSRKKPINREFLCF